jgi:hypothetical protein
MSENQLNKIESEVARLEEELKLVNQSQTTKEACSE